MTTKSGKLPKSAMALYVTLYCKRRNRTENKNQNNLMEATKSWLSLSEHEKLNFLEKYRDCQGAYKKKVANYLKNAKPYMKMRTCIRAAESTNHCQNYIAEKNNNEINDQPLPLEINKSLYEANPQMETHMPQIEEDIPSLSQNYEETNIMEEYLESVIPEPIPPNLKTGQELFEIVNAMEENSLTWSSLTQLQKRRYQYAVLSIKKDYLIKYKAYLETLSAKKLFKHYKEYLLDS